MYLSRIELDPRRRQTRRLEGSPQVAHALVAKACAAGTPAPDGATEGRILWRLDVGEWGHTLYVVSPGQPDLSQIWEETSYPDEAPRTADYEPFLARLKAGDTWAYRLTANPQRALAAGPGERGKRAGHVTATQQGQWFLDRASKCGIELLLPPLAQDGDAAPAGVVDPAAVVVRREKPSFRRANPDGGGYDQVQINRVTYEGLLRITDVPALRHVLTHGLGASKGHGCGLLTLAPVRR